MDDRPINRRNKAAFSNSCGVWIGPYNVLKFGRLCSFQEIPNKKRDHRALLSAVWIMAVIVAYNSSESSGIKKKDDLSVDVANCSIENSISLSNYL